MWPFWSSCTFSCPQPPFSPLLSSTSRFSTMGTRRRDMCRVGGTIKIREIRSNGPKRSSKMRQAISIRPCNVRPSSTTQSLTRDFKRRFALLASSRSKRNELSMLAAVLTPALSSTTLHNPKIPPIRQPSKQAA